MWRSIDSTVKKLFSLGDGVSKIAEVNEIVDSFQSSNNSEFYLDNVCMEDAENRKEFSSHKSL